MSAPKKIKPLVAGNWKMNGTGADLRELRRLHAGLAKHKFGCDVAVCVPRHPYPPAVGHEVRGKIHERRSRLPWR